MSKVRILLCLLMVVVSEVYSQHLFASDFHAPQPPQSIVAEYKAAFVQHKWDSTGISHITTGMIYAKPSIGRLRMDITYDGTIASSLFDYAKANTDGSIPNMIYQMSPSTATAGICSFFNVTPAYPLFPPNILTQSQATFVGLITDNLFYANDEPLHAWSILFGSSTSVTAFVDSGNKLVRIDFSSPFRNTFTTTRLFNISPGTLSSNLFADPCPPGSSTASPATSGASKSG